MTCYLNVAGPGCCPIGTDCNAPAICLDHASANCSSSNQALPPPPQCCPSDLPFCRDFQPEGLGCYNSSTTAASSSSVPAMTAAGTSDLFASASASTTTGTSAAVDGTASVVLKGDGGRSVEFVSAGSNGVPTTYVYEPMAIFSTTVISVTSTASATPAKVVTSSRSVESSTKTIVSSAATSSSISSPSSARSTVASSSTISASSSTISPLCYDPGANSHSPCPTTTAPPTPSSTSSGGFNPPGATTVESQASKLSLPSLDPLRTLFTTQRGQRALLTYLLAAYIAYACLRLLLLLRIGGATWRSSDLASHQRAPRFSTTLHHAILPGFAMLALALVVARTSSLPPPYTGWESFCWLAILLLLLGACESAVGFYEAAAFEGRIDVVKATLRECGYDGAAIETILAGPPGKGDEEEEDAQIDSVKESRRTAAEAETQKQDITVVSGSARPWLPPRVVSKGQIRVVKGSARPFVKGKRTHSLWEGMGKGAVRLDGEEEAAAAGEVEGMGEIGDVSVGAKGA
ncbi:MAG: hypothetical protein ASARMPREDX12_002288 [Alectoria sarmentosa]|nr:MAG: hypothetical protein ASARMPREDX12_002288 [Alectoria sarmentosa]